jgi:hypothetical protein
MQYSLVQGEIACYGSLRSSEPGVALGGASGAIQREQALVCARLVRVSRIAYVSGRLGAGKSSLAGPLAAELGYSLAAKDLIKETLPVRSGRRRD